MRAAGAERGDDHAIHINQTNVVGVRVIGVIGVVGVIAFAVVGGVIKVVDGHRTEVGTDVGTSAGSPLRLA